MKTQYERDSKKATKVLTRFQVFGESRRGRMARREGKPVTCGHLHLTKDEAAPCLEELRKNRLGNCQRYSISQVKLLAMPVKAGKKRKPV